MGIPEGYLPCKGNYRQVPLPSPRPQAVSEETAAGVWAEGTLQGAETRSDFASTELTQALPPCMKKWKLYKGEPWEITASPEGCSSSGLVGIHAGMQWATLTFFNASSDLTFLEKSISLPVHYGFNLTCSLKCSVLGRCDLTILSYPCRQYPDYAGLRNNSKCTLLPLRWLYFLWHFPATVFPFSSSILAPFLSRPPPQSPSRQPLV